MTGSQQGSLRARLETLPRSQVAAWLAVIALALPFAWPFMRGPFPDSGDGLLNLYRVVALDYAVRHGDLWPRFLAAMHFGYGAPNFNYYSPLSLYAIELIHLISRLDFPAAYRLAIVIYALFAGLGAYQIGRLWAGTAGGLAAAAAYLYAPPLFHTFDLPAQFAALALFPWILWSLSSLAAHRRRRDFAAATLFASALFLAHNITALYFAPMVALYGLLLAWGSQDRLRALVILWLPLIFAVGLTTFFWLPALAEAEYVQLERLDIPMFDFHHNFLSLRTILGWPFHPGAEPLFKPEPLSVGWPQVALGLLGTATVFWPGQTATLPEARQQVSLCLLLVAVSLFLVTPASAWVWERAPLVKLILFPKRLLYPASLFLALLAGLGVAGVMSRIGSRGGQAAWLVGCLAIMILYSLPSQTISYMDKPPRTRSILDLHDLERDTGWLAMTSAGEFVPRWVRQMPHAWALTDRFYEQDIIPRLQANQSVQIQAEEWEMLAGTVTLRAEEDSTLVFEWFYFPGWRAWLDGQPVDIAPTDPHGLIGVPVPAGEHQVSVRFGSTPVRTWATVASLIALTVWAALIGLMRGLWRSRDTADDQNGPSSPTGGLAS